MEMVKLILEKIKAQIPVEWDRFTSTEDGYYVVFGWIPRSDGQRDFLMITMEEYDLPEDIFFSTSSAKYSKKIMEALMGTSEGHNDCRKISELYADPTEKGVAV